jgi:hypothetical protein
VPEFLDHPSRLRHELTGHRDLAVDGKSQLHDYRPYRVRTGLRQLFRERKSFRTPKRVPLLFLKQLLQSTVLEPRKADFHTARQLKSMSHRNTTIAQSTSGRAIRTMPAWQSNDYFQVSEHLPILRVGLTLHKPIAGLRRAAQGCATSGTRRFWRHQQMGVWGTDYRPLLIWLISKRFAHACITLSPKARLAV